MNTQSIFKRLFPQPTAVFTKSDGSDVSGLPKDTVPQNCDIIASGLYQGSLPGRREYYLVRVDGTMVFLRVCAAAPDSGYDEYAVIREAAESPEAQASLEARAREAIAAICRAW